MKTEKMCNLCGKVKPVEDFVTKRNKCKKCHAANNVEWRKNNQDLNRQIQSEYGKRKRLEAKLNKQN